MLRRTERDSQGGLGASSARWTRVEERGTRGEGALVRALWPGQDRKSD